LDVDGHFDGCDGFAPSDSLQGWWPDHYLSKFEWYAQTHESALSLVWSYFNYDYLFNPNIIRILLNSYHTGGSFLPIEHDAFTTIYNYFLDVIPGFEYFGTHTALDWIKGHQNPFLTFFTNLTIYEAGEPSGTSIYKIATQNHDKPYFPKHV
jgi:hypothetical protein